jgi:hypothetical protein
VNEPLTPKQAIEILKRIETEQGFPIYRDIASVITELQKELDQSRADLETPQLARIQPCGCVLCICDDSESCLGCGAKSCERPECVMRYNPEQRVYDDALTYQQLRQREQKLVDALKDIVSNWGVAVSIHRHVMPCG